MSSHPSHPPILTPADPPPAPPATAADAPRPLDAADAMRVAAHAPALVAALFTQSPFSVALYDAEGRVAFANPAYERHWGIRLADVPREYSLFRDPQLAASGLLALIERAYAGEHVVLPPVRYDAAQASGVAPARTVWTQGHCYPVRDAGGALTHVAILHEDVSARMEQEAALRASEARFRSLAETLPHTVWTATPDGALDYMSHRFTAYTGRPLEEGRVAGFMRVLHPDDRAGSAERWARAVAEGTRYEVEHRVRRADGEYLWHMSVAVPQRDVSGAIVKWVGSTTDTNERREAEDALRRARAEAESANRAKSEFLATMSHELRTPLNAIAGYAELMQLGVPEPAPPSHHDYLARIRSAQRHLLSLIDAVLNFARLEAGHVEFSIATVRVDALLAAVEPLVAPQMRSKGLAYECAAPDATLAVVADGDKVVQVLLNLVSNALKFTPAGGSVRVSARRDGGRVAIEVRDSGVGIPPERVDSIFDPFVQVDARLTRTSEGVGLGLAISRDLARGMGGDLVVESVPGAGSVFRLLLPAG